VKLSAVRTNEGRLFQTVRAQHENRRAAVCLLMKTLLEDLVIRLLKRYLWHG